MSADNVVKVQIGLFLIGTFAAIAANIIFKTPYLDIAGLACFAIAIALSYFTRDKEPKEHRRKLNILRPIKKEPEKMKESVVQAEPPIKMKAISDEEVAEIERALKREIKTPTIADHTIAERKEDTVEIESVELEEYLI